MANLAKSRQESAGMFLTFYDEILEELRKQDALCILASGLGILEMVYKFIEMHANSKSLVFVLNLSHHDIEFINMRLLSNTADADDKLFYNVTHGISAQDRQNMYLCGGCLCITSRILVTDLLSGVIPFASITGILINNVDQLCKSSNLSFVLEIFRRHNRRGFIKGFSENAEKFGGAHTSLKEVMQRLFVSKVTIWPRFRVSVEESIKRRTAQNAVDTVELHIKLSESMRVIQECIMEIMEACLNELKTTSIVNMPNITVENGLFNDFEFTLYVTFKPHWNKLSDKTKNLISDLINLRRLLRYVLSYDAITFYRHLMSLKRSSFDKQTNTPKSIWLLTDAAEKLIVTAKKRVYQYFDNVKAQNNPQQKRGRKRKQDVRNSTLPHKRRRLAGIDCHENAHHHANGNRDNDEGDDGDDERLEENLEVNPKWTWLMKVIKEIRKLQNTHKGKLTAPILIVCRNKSTAKQLTDIICNGAEDLMRKYWRKYLAHLSAFNHIQNGNELSSQQKEMNCLLAHYYRLRHRDHEDSQIDHVLHDLDDNNDAGNDGNSDANTDEQDDPFMDLTNEEQKHKQELLSAFESEHTHSYNMFNRNGIKEEISDCMMDEESSSTSNSPSASNHNNNAINPAKNHSNCGKKKKYKMSESERQQFAFKDALDQLCAGLSARSYVSNASKIIVHSLSDMDDAQNNRNLLLWQLKPEFVVLYDSDLKFIRELEIYHCYYNSKTLRIYLLSYTSSIEEQMYLSHIRREKDSFLKLINEKGDMILPNNVNRRFDESTLKLPSQQFGGASTEKSKRSQKMDSANILNPSKMDKVIVDIREFRNSTSLPLMLYRENMNVIPVTLKVGDYILSPKLCVERKCVSDLFSSMLHGRLYDQILQITRYYAVPILLIEFDEKKSFSLQSVKQIPQNISLANIISKMVILSIHFNRLTMLWSRSPQITTKLFRVLKSNRPQPDLNTSITITNSANSSSAAADDDHDNEQDSNQDMHTPKDILRSLPGVNHSNVDKILQKCDNLKHLCSKSKQEVMDMLGNKDGKLLYEFLHTNFFNEC